MNNEVNMQKILCFIKRKSLMSNTIVILITGFIIKILGLIYKIIIIRLLDTDGMELYVMIFPTLLLFTTISGFSLNVTTTKLIADAYETRKYSPKQLLKKSIKLSFIVSTFTLIIFLLINNFLITNLLKNSKLLLPSLAIIPLLYLVGISDSLRGYFSGIKEVSTSSISILIEQLSRIISSLTLIIIFSNYPIELRVFLCLLGQSIGEIGSIIYTLIKIKNLTDFLGTESEEKAILKMALPLTFSRLIGNFTYFLEPIIYTSFFLWLDYSQNNITKNYTIINAYTIPLLTMFSFFSIAISNSIIPYVSTAYVNHDNKKLNFYFQKVINYALIPGTIISIILFFYSKEIMYLLYKTQLGSTEVKKTIFIFLIYYIHLPISSFLQAMGQNRFLMLTSVIFNFVRLLLICALGFIPIFNLNSLLYAVIFSMVLSTIVQLAHLKKLSKIKIDYKSLLTIATLGLFISFLIIIFNFLKIPCFFVIILISIIYFIFLNKLNFIKINRFNNN